MQKGYILQFDCASCKKPVRFSVFDLENNDAILHCESCRKKYSFNDEALKRQLKKFEALCRQIHESEEILADTAVGIDVANHHVKVPYKLLLTRLNTTLELKVGEKPIKIEFRIEPPKDMPKTVLEKLKPEV